MRSQGTEMNETAGRTLETEPSPFISIDIVFCFWKNARITKHEAQAIFTPNNIECDTCMECQACET